MALALIPTLTPRRFDRMAPREVEQMITAAKMRHAHTVDLLAIHALWTGQFPERKTFRDLTGRESPMPLDPRDASEEDPAAVAEAATSISLARTEGLAERGVGSIGTLSPDELARAFAEAEAE